MKADFLQHTFQLTPGLGPWREKNLWAQGLDTWADFEARAAKGPVMSARLDQELLAAIARARAALATRDWPTLVALLSPREQWRLYPQMVDQAAFFDIEADGDHQPTIAGVMDSAGLGSYRLDTDLEAFPERLARSPLWVTFNGRAFDVPALEKYFGRRFPKAVLHLDLRFLTRRAGLSGGLKGIERALHLDRPPHLTGLHGLDAIKLWRAWVDQKDLTTLRVLVEYNLYDAINLRAVMEQTLWRVAEHTGWRGPRTPGFERGDVLYDVSRLILGLGG